MSGTRKHRWYWISALVVVVTAALLSTVSAPPAPAAPEGGWVTPDRSDEGLERDESCGRGGYRVQDTDRCTHGPDPAPPGVKPYSDYTPPKDPAPEAATEAVCDGDGVSGRRVQVLYTRTPDRPDRYTSVVGQLRKALADAEKVFTNSAAETGGIRKIRWVQTSTCDISIVRISLPRNDLDDDFGKTSAFLRDNGYNRADRKYMILADSTQTTSCGIADLLLDERKDSTVNISNNQVGWALVIAGCWLGSPIAHELMHNLGGVQNGAPNTTGAGHCVDEWDVMCYSDEPNFPAMRFDCPNDSHEQLFDCNHDDYFHTNPRTNSYLSTKWNSADSGYLNRGPHGKWGYVWANSPTTASYTPSPSYQFTSAPGNVPHTITRSGVGVYTVRFVGLGGTGNGTVHVTAYGGGGAFCNTAGWQPGASGTAEVLNMLVKVRCYAANGSPADSTFTAEYNHAVAYPSTLAYVWANLPSSADYSPSPAYQFNSTNATNTVLRNGVGDYTVRLPGLRVALTNTQTGGEGNVQVTAYGTGPITCKRGTQTNSSSTGLLVNVHCVNAQNVKVDSQFTMTFGHRLGVTGVPGQRAGYITNFDKSQPTARTSHSFNWRGQTNSVRKTATGSYEVKFPLLGAGAGHVQVTTLGSEATRCKVTNWQQSGTDLLVNVGCHAMTTNNLADAPFSVNYVQNTAG